MASKVQSCIVYSRKWEIFIICITILFFRIGILLRKKSETVWAIQRKGNICVCADLIWSKSGKTRILGTYIFIFLRSYTFVVFLYYFYAWREYDIFSCKVNSYVLSICISKCSEAARGRGRKFMRWWSLAHQNYTLITNIGSGQKIAVNI